MSELKACPFCGQTAHVSDSFIDAEQVGCFYCVAFVDTDIWNTRPIEDQLRAENEKLKEALKYIVDRGYTGASYVAQQALKEVAEC